MRNLCQRITAWSKNPMKPKAKKNLRASGTIRFTVSHDQNYKDGIGAVHTTASPHCLDRDDLDPGLQE